MKLDRRFEPRLNGAWFGRGGFTKGTRYDTTVFRPATFIERAMSNLSHSMLFGCGLVIIILFLFLAEWRSALISAIVIPISLLES